MYTWALAYVFISFISCFGWDYTAVEGSANDYEQNTVSFTGNVMTSQHLLNDLQSLNNILILRQSLHNTATRFKYNKILNWVNRCLKTLHQPNNWHLVM